MCSPASSTSTREELTLFHEKRPTTDINVHNQTEDAITVLEDGVRSVGAARHATHHAHLLVYFHANHVLCKINYGYHALHALDAHILLHQCRHHPRISWQGWEAHGDTGKFKIAIQSIGMLC